MIYGKRNEIKNINLQICLGYYIKEIKLDEESIKHKEIISGSKNSIQKLCKNNYIKLEPGTNKYSNLRKEIKKRLKIEIENIEQYIPNYSKILKK